VTHRAQKLQFLCDERRMSPGVPGCLDSDHDRRREVRGTSGGAPTRPQLVSMVMGSYREMPGLCLHLNQAARLFDIRPETCQLVLDHLVGEGKLRRLDDGQYVRG